MSIYYYNGKIFRLNKRVKIIFYKYWNRFKFFTSGINYGKNLSVWCKLYLFLDKQASVKIGNNFTFTSGDALNPLSRNINGCIHVNEGGILSIGDNTGISSACIWVHKKITIGNNVNIGGDVIMMDSDAHSLDYLNRRDGDLDFRDKQDVPICIGDDVLIGVRSIILKGVSIGDRSVIGAGSVVTKDIPPDCIAAGNPCKVIKYLK